MTQEAICVIVDVTKSTLDVAASDSGETRQSAIEFFDTVAQNLTLEAKDGKSCRFTDRCR